MTAAARATAHRSASVRPLREPLQDRSRRTRAALLEAGAREFSERGFQATTSKSVAARAGVATGSFYEYFQDKDAVLREIARERLGRITQESLAAVALEPGNAQRPTRAALEARLSHVVAVVMREHRADPGLHAVLTERRHADADLDALTSEGERLLLDSVEKLLERWGYEGDLRASAFVLIAAVEGAVHAHVLGKPAVSDARFLRALAAALGRLLHR